MARNALREILEQYATAHRVVLGVNADNPEMLRGIAHAVQIHEIPVFIQLTPETLSLWGYDFFTKMMEVVIDTLPVPVSWHLDHATSLVEIEKALDFGFTSVMYDGSALPMEENIENTRQVVQWAHPKGVLVEAEIGHVPKPGEPDAWAKLTLPEEARHFAQATGIGALAVAIGNHHATHVKNSQIDLERLRAIHAVCPVPLVLHGASGVPVALYDELRSRGIAKMNFGTEFRSIWWQTVEAMLHDKPRLVQTRISQKISDAVGEKFKRLS